MRASTTAPPTSQRTSTAPRSSSSIAITVPASALRTDSPWTGCVARITSRASSCSRTRAPGSTPLRLTCSVPRPTASSALPSAGSSRVTTPSTTAPTSSVPIMLVQLRAQAHLVHRAVCRHAAAIEQHQVRGEAQHLLELVAHVHHGDRQPIAQRLEVGQHLLAARGVERGERLIEQQQTRLRQQRAPERHALALAAGELARPPPEQRARDRAAPITSSKPMAAGAERAARARNAGCPPPSGAGTAAHPGTRSRCGAARAARRCRARVSVSTSSSRRTSPASGASSPEIMLTRVVLPLPERPNSATTPGVGAANSACSAKPGQRLLTETCRVPMAVSAFSGRGSAVRAAPVAPRRAVPRGRARTTAPPAAAPVRPRPGTASRCRARAAACG